MNKKDETEKRRNKLNFRLTDSELSAFKHLSARLGMTYTELFTTAIASLRSRIDGRGER